MPCGPRGTGGLLLLLRSVTGAQRHQSPLRTLSWHNPLIFLASTTHPIHLPYVSFEAFHHPTGLNRARKLCPLLPANAFARRTRILHTSGVRCFAECDFRGRGTFPSSVRELETVGFGFTHYLTPLEGSRTACFNIHGEIVPVFDFSSELREDVFFEDVSME